MVMLKSKNFTLRPFKKTDVPSLLKQINDSKVSRYLLRVNYPYTEKDAKNWLTYCTDAKRKKDSAIFAISISGKLVGICSLNQIEGHKAEIGYWIGKGYWGKHVGREAIKMLTEYGLKKLKLRRIYATVFTKNRASARILEINKFKYEGRLEKYFMKNGKIRDALMYAKTR